MELATAEHPASIAEETRFGPASERLGPLVAIGGAFLLLSIWSWRKWPDPLVDFGRELYLAWQLTDGKVLYRDVASLFGPLSPYINALWFRIGGVSLGTLILFNLAILAATGAAVFHLVRQASDRLTATAAVVTVFALFGFSQYTATGNYNFVCPYSHEATHGIALATAMILTLCLGLSRRRGGVCGFAGILFGLVLLTKAEVALAAAVAAVTAFAVSAFLPSSESDSRALTAAAFLAGATSAPVAFLLYLSRYMSGTDAAIALLAPFTGAANASVAALDFYVAGAGFDRPGRNLILMAAMFAAIVAFAGALAFVASSLSRRAQRSMAAERSTRLLCQTAVVLAVAAGIARWPVARALPLITAAVLVTLTIRVYRERREPGAARLMPLLCWCAFGLALMPKMLLNARLSHYGFYLAMPATVVLIVALLWLIPESMRDARARSRFRSMALMAIATGIAIHLAFAHGIYRRKTRPVGNGADRFFAFDTAQRWQGAAVAHVMELIERSVPAGATLAVLPEGAMINYLARRSNPTPYHTIMPPEQLIYGEDRIVAAYALRPPDYVLLMPKDVSEYGVLPFGKDPWYGARLRHWLARHYEETSIIGSGVPGEVITLMKRGATDR